MTERVNHDDTTTRRHDDKRVECFYKHRDASGGRFRCETFGMELQLSVSSCGIVGLGWYMARVAQGTSGCIKIIRDGCIVANP